MTRRILPSAQRPPDPHHLTDEDLGEGGRFDLEGTCGIRRLVGVVGAQDQCASFELNPPQGAAVLPGQGAGVEGVDLSVGGPPAALALLVSVEIPRSAP